jgi:hypothetical protein
LRCDRAAAHGDGREHYAGKVNGHTHETQCSGWR